MALNFVCRGSKVSKKDGLTPHELYVIIDGKRRYISLNRRIDPKTSVIQYGDSVGFDCNLNGFSLVIISMVQGIHYSFLQCLIRIVEIPY